MLTCFSLLVFDYSINKKIYSPAFILNIIFLFIIFLTMVNPSDLTTIHIRTYLIILLGIISFNLGQILSKRTIKKHNKQAVNQNNRFEINNHRYKRLIIIALIFSSIMLKNSLNIILHGGGLAEIYQERIASSYVDNTLMDSSPIEASIINYISNPLVALSTVVSIILFYKTSKFKYLIISFVFLLIQSFSTGGRSNMIYYIIYISVGLFSVKNIKQLIKRYIKYIIILMILLIFLGIYFITERQTDIFKTIVSYFGYPIYHLDYKLNQLYDLNYTFGLTSFMSIFNLLDYPLRLFGFKEWVLLTNAKDMIYYADATANLGNGINYNAFVTCFYHFYVDGGYIGVFILSLFFGMFSGWCFYRFIYEKNNDFFQILFYLSFACPVVFSFVRFQYCNAMIPFALIYSYLILFRKKTFKFTIKEKNNKIE